MSGDMTTKNPQVAGGAVPGVGVQGGVISPQDPSGGISGTSSTGGANQTTISSPQSPDGVWDPEILKELYEKMKADLQELMRYQPQQAPNGGQPAGGPQQNNEAQKLLEEAEAKEKEAEGLEQPKQEALEALTDTSAKKGAAETKVSMTESNLENAEASLESAKSELSAAQALPDFITVIGPDGKPRQVPNPEKPPKVAAAQQKVNQAQEKVDKLKTDLETAKKELEEATTKEKEAKEKHKGIEEKQKTLKAEAQKLREQAQQMQQNQSSGGGGGQPTNPFPDPSFFEDFKNKLKQYMEEILKKLGLLDKGPQIDTSILDGMGKGDGASNNGSNNGNGKGGSTPSPVPTVGAGAPTPGKILQ